VFTVVFHHQRRCQSASNEFTFCKLWRQSDNVPL
jgi:hypothetical protein